MNYLSAVALLVREYDEAIAYFVDKLDFELSEDTPLTAEKRWVRVTPKGGQSSILLARAVTPEQIDRIGSQSGGRVWLFLHTDNLDRDYAQWTAKGVHFLETPRDEPFGKVVTFADLYGNVWDLVEKKGEA